MQARASSTEADTDLILKTSSTAANASERMLRYLWRNHYCRMGEDSCCSIDIQGSSTTTLTGLRIRNMDRIDSTGCVFNWFLIEMEVMLISRQHL